MAIYITSGWVIICCNYTPIYSVFLLRYGKSPAEASDVVVLGPSYSHELVHGLFS